MVTPALNPSPVDVFIKAYIECALWSTHLDGNDECLDSVYDASDLHPAALASITEDCRQFQSDNASDLQHLDAVQCGHDFWLTRNRHGAGFWDRGLGAVVTRLTNAAKVWGSVDLCIGEDDMIHI